MSARAQAPVITGWNFQDGACTQTFTSYILDAESGSNNIIICGNNFDSTLTVHAANSDGEERIQPFIPGTALFTTPPNIGGQTSRDFTLCNSAGCTFYPAGLRYDPGTIPEPADYHSSNTSLVVDESEAQFKVDGGWPVTVRGQYLDKTTSLTACGNEGFVYQAQSPLQVVVIVPGYQGGPTSCTLYFNSAAGSHYLPFTLDDSIAPYPVIYINPEPPSIGQVDPGVGSAAGGATIKILGNYFGEGDSVTIGGVAATSVTVVNHQTLSVVVPAHAAGAVVVAVTGPNGTASISGQFTYVGGTSLAVADKTNGLGVLSLSGSLTSGFTGSGGNGLAVSNTGSVWSLDASGTGLSQFTDTGVLSHDYTGLSLLNAPAALATDGNGATWIANSGNGTVTAVSSSGTAIGGVAVGGASIGAAPSAIAVDQAGGVWVASKSGNSVTHILGVAAPVVTPTATGVADGTLGKRP